MCTEDHAHDHNDHEYGVGAWDDETAERYVEKWGEDPTNLMAVEYAQLEPDDVVVDIGCGSGTAVRETADRVLSGRVVGVDPTPAMIRFAEELSASHEGRNRMEYLEGSAEDLPLPDASATVALAINSLHHWVDPPVGLAETLRVLKPGGRLFVADEEHEGRWGHPDGPLADPAAVERVVKEAGFVEISVSKHAKGDVKMLLLSARKKAS